MHSSDDAAAAAPDVPVAVQTAAAPASELPLQDAPAAAVVARSPFADWPGDESWQSLPQDALRSFRLTALLTALSLSLGFGVMPVVFATMERGFEPLALLWTLAVSALLIGLLRWRAGTQWRNTRWRLDEDGLRVRRGRFWRHEVLVPRTRVQHLDVERGPIERRYGLATLIVHTAGTRLNALRQPGFDESTAAALRDALVPKRREQEDVPEAADVVSAMQADIPPPLPVSAAATPESPAQTGETHPAGSDAPAAQTAAVQAPAPSATGDDGVAPAAGRPHG